MRTDIGCVAVLLGMMGCVMDAGALGGSDTSLAGKRGLSPNYVVEWLVVSSRGVGEGV